MTSFLMLSLLMPAMVVAQQPVAAPLKPANGALSGGFTNVASMHELRDGRVVLSDMMARRFGIGDFSTKKFEPIADVNPGIIVPLPGDSTLIVGFQTGWVFLFGARPIGMLPLDNPVLKAAALVDGADAMGNVLTTQGSFATQGDSIPVVLVERATARQDTVARLWMPPPTKGGVSGPLFTVYEESLMSIDGWVAVLRIAPYCVDWRAPDGHWTLGQPIPAPVVDLDQREKAAYMVRRARGKTPDAPETITNWPATVPPFRIGYPPVASPDGKLLVLRTQTADLPDVRYDVINRRGEVERQVTMPANEHILGFGMHSVYVRVAENDGTQTVQRHPWP